jgi:hypothetical protein
MDAEHGEVKLLLSSQRERPRIPRIYSLVWEPSINRPGKTAATCSDCLWTEAGPPSAVMPSFVYARLLCDTTLSSRRGYMRLWRTRRLMRPRFDRGGTT